jgi:uncharacterized protein YjbJ (UPF0337 family)
MGRTAAMSAASKVKDAAKRDKGKAGGAGRDAKGRFKAGVGAAIGDTRTQAEGMAEQVVGGVKKTAGKAGVAPRGSVKRAVVGAKKKVKAAPK